MRSVFLSTCQYCGTEYYSHNVRRLYCSERCRRDFQNDRRAGERAEERELREQLWGVDEKPHYMQDPWAAMDAEDAAWDNALLDAAPVLEDSPWGGPSVAVQPVGKTDKLRKRKKHEGQLMLPGMEAWRS